MGQGYPELLSLLSEHKQQGGEPLDFHIFGTGDDMPEIKARAKADGTGIQFHEGVDHLDEQLAGFRQFPSLMLACPTKKPVKFCCRNTSALKFSHTYSNVCSRSCKQAGLRNQPCPAVIDYVSSAGIVPVLDQALAA